MLITRTKVVLAVCTKVVLADNNCHVDHHGRIRDRLTTHSNGETRNPHAIASIKPRDAAQPQSVRKRS